jgi:hypothetical protein
MVKKRRILLWSIKKNGWTSKIFFFFVSVLFSLLKFIQISIPNTLKDFIQQLIDQHKKVYQKIKDLHDHDHPLDGLTQELTRTVETLVWLFYCKIILRKIRFIFIDGHTSSVWWLY